MNLQNFIKNYDIENYKIENDNLTVGGDLNLRGTNITALPDNLTVGGYLDLEDTNITALPDNLIVGGYLDLRGTNITALPDNLTVGGYLNLEDTNITETKNIKKLTTNFLKVLRLDLQVKFEAKLIWKNGKYRKIDGLFCEIISQKNNIFKVKIKNKIAFIFQKNNISAHGYTVRQAYLDWLFKTSDRDIEQYKNIDKNEPKNQDYWVIAYRTITGACAFGTNNFLENNREKIKKEMTLAEVLEATQGQYGHTTFKEFFEK